MNKEERRRLEARKKQRNARLAKNAIAALLAAAVVSVALVLGTS